jgi:hypothetical protein
MVFFGLLCKHVNTQHELLTNIYKGRKQTYAHIFDRSTIPLPPKKSIIVISFALLTQYSGYWQAAYKQLRAIEEKLELERTAHLESNFNSEIVQLRVRDLEGALESEKVANGEAKMNIDMLKQQLSYQFSGVL